MRFCSCFYEPPIIFSDPHGLTFLCYANSNHDIFCITVLSRKYEEKLLRTLHKHHPAHQYSAQWNGMSVHGIFLTFHGWMVVPVAARRKVLSNLHLQHTGRSKTLPDARQLYFWLGMTNAIELMIANCKECTTALPSQPLEPQIPTKTTRPFKRISIDLGYQKGNNYLIGMDRYSGWPMAAPIPRKANTTTIKDILDEWFVDHGIPVSIRTDRGPQFCGLFDEWCRRNTRIAKGSKWILIEEYPKPNPPDNIKPNSAASVTPPLKPETILSRNQANKIRPTKTSMNPILPP